MYRGHRGGDGTAVLLGHWFIVGRRGSQRARDRIEQQAKTLDEQVKAGQVKHKETVVRGLDQAVGAFLGLFSGQNIGKMIVDLL